MIGKTISHYQIVEKIGEGGMGVVYKAKDKHLDRYVALKLLPADKLASTERKRRFVQEAKAASALNHPNIVHVYDIAEADGVDYIAMEYVPGKTLDRVVPRGGLRVGEVLAYSVQIADALSKAHAAGIVHRDLKPSNLIVGDDGRVRVLDFGLAKLTDPQEVTADERTRTVALEDDQRTEEGTILGTSSYMSPEQAEGKAVDRRSDIFSFGAVLYEMVTGRRAFRGGTNMSTLALIIHEEPKPVADLADDLPSELERIINRCLRKNPARRFQHMEDLCVALLELKEESESGTLVARPTGTAAPRKRARWWPAAAAGAALLAFAGGWFVRTGSEATIPMESADTLPVPSPLTSFPGSEGAPDFSPDGDRVVFVWDGKSGDNQDIYVKLVGESAAQRLTTDPATDSRPKWSPDGRSILFGRRGDGVTRLILIPSIGGTERELLTSEDVRLGDHAWWPDSKHIALTGRHSRDGPSMLYRVSIETRELQPLAATSGPRDSYSSPAVSPDGRQVVIEHYFGAQERAVLLLDLTESFEPAGEPQIISGDVYASSPAWSADGEEIIFAARVPGEGWGLRRVSRQGGESVKILNSSRARGIAISQSGERLAYSVSSGRTDDVWRVTPRRGAEPERLIQSTYIDRQPQYSPDGQRIAFSSDRSGAREIWLCDQDGANARQLTFLKQGVTSGPTWSPDGRTIAFQSQVENQREIYTVSVNGGAPRRITDHPAVETEPTWSRTEALSTSVRIVEVRSDSGKSLRKAVNRRW